MAGKVGNEGPVPTLIFWRVLARSVVQDTLGSNLFALCFLGRKAPQGQQGPIAITEVVTLVLCKCHRV
eukprot:4567150-Amphidinium_carterae.1